MRHLKSTHLSFMPFTVIPNVQQQCQLYKCTTAVPALQLYCVSCTQESNYLYATLQNTKRVHSEQLTADRLYIRQKKDAQQLKKDSNVGDYTCSTMKQVTVTSPLCHYISWTDRLQGLQQKNKKSSIIQQTQRSSE